MKKLLLIVVLTAAFITPSLTLQAQPGERFGDNMFVSLKGGMGIYSNRLNENPRGFSGGISVGKWIVSPLAFRVSFDFMTIPNASTLKPYTAQFALGSAEFLWDFTSTFMRIRNWRVKVYPMLGLGVVFEGSSDGSHLTDHEFQAMLGAQANFVITPRWDAFLEYKCNFFPEAFDGSSGDVYLHSFLLGFSHQFTEGPFRRRTAGESRDVMEDWFFGFGVGPNFSSFTFEHMDKMGMYGAAPEIMFGRNYSNFWTIRFELAGLTAHERYDTINDEAGKGYTFSTFHTDVMVNLTHALKFSRGKKLNVLPYLGAGLAWRYDNARKITYFTPADAKMIPAFTDSHLEGTNKRQPLLQSNGWHWWGTMINATYGSVGYVHPSHTANYLMLDGHVTAIKDPPTAEYLKQFVKVGKETL